MDEFSLTYACNVCHLLYQFPRNPKFLNGITSRHFVHTFVHRSIKTESMGRNLFTPFNKVWFVTGRIFTKTRASLTAFCEEFLYRINGTVADTTSEIQGQTEGPTVAIARSTEDVLLCFETKATKLLNYNPLSPINLP
jgi:hypothetical protein